MIIEKTGATGTYYAENDTSYYVCIGCEHRMVVPKYNSQRDINWHIYFQCQPNYEVSDEEWNNYRKHNYFPAEKWHKNFYNKVVARLSENHLKPATPWELNQVKKYKSKMKKLNEKNIIELHSVEMDKYMEMLTEKINENKLEYDEKLKNYEIAFDIEKNVAIAAINKNEDVIIRKICDGEMGIEIRVSLIEDTKFNCKREIQEIHKKYLKRLTKIDKRLVKLRDRKNNIELKKTNKKSLKTSLEYFGDCAGRYFNREIKRTELCYNKILPLGKKKLVNFDT